MTKAQAYKKDLPTCPGLVVKKGDSFSQGLEFESQTQIIGTYLIFHCIGKNCLRKPKKIQKDAEEGAISREQLSNLVTAQTSKLLLMILFKLLS